MTERDTPRGGTPAEWDRLAELHERASAAGPEERGALLAALRRSDPALAAELGAMLEATPTAAGLELESRLRRPEAIASLAAGERVGPWRLLRFLARGGMGEVYLAERADGAFDQQVAVKMLRPGVGSADLLERFRLERNLLARLEHPAIAPLLDAGATDDGRPYLALRYVEGRPITRYCEEMNLAPRRRAELFVELCRAVQFAHANLVVHRDLKPSNVLVDTAGRVQLLDFGIAKLLSPDDPTSEPTRELELAPMTPQRAAPEQRRGEPATTATDVWALGILLHELLTGTLPRAALASAASADAADSDDSGDGASPAGEQVHRSQLGRDLSAVVAHALEPLPRRRYGSAGELADDVQRWLRGEPVMARPDSLGYRALRFVGRHRIAVAASAAAVVALALSTAVSVARSHEAARQREAAASAAGRSQAVVDLMVELFGGLDPTAGADLDTVRISALVALGAERANRLADQPDVQARLRHVLGRIQLERSAWQSALPLLQQARDAELARLPGDDVTLVPLLLDYARALHLTGDRGGASAEAERALARVELAPEPAPLLLASALGTAGELGTGEAAEARIARSLAILRATSGASPLDIAANLTALAWFQRGRGERQAAWELFSEAHAILRAERGDENLLTLSLRSNLASMLDDPAERVREHGAILAVRRSRLGDHHYMVANSWSALAAAQIESGDFAAAASGYEHAHSIWVETNGPGNPMALAALRHRARALDRAAAGPDSSAASAAGAAWAQLASELEGARGNPRTLAGHRVELALHYLKSDRPELARGEAEAAIALLHPLAEPAPATQARARAALGRALLALGRPEEAHPELEAALAGMNQNAPDDPQELAATRRALGLPIESPEPRPKAASGSLAHPAVPPTRP